ncbi:MAG: hypothetical protein N2C14_33445, partial [Planctomycetales bacterium]
CVLTVFVMGVSYVRHRNQTFSAIRELGVRLECDHVYAGRFIHVDSTESIAGSMFGDDVIGNLSKVVVVSNSKTDVVFRKLAGIPELRYLAVTDSEITEIGWRNLKQLRQIRTLSINFQHLKDRDFELLAELDQLTDLSLWNVQVIDTNAVPLGRMKNLRSLELRGTGVSLQAVERLKRENPTLTVTVSRDPSGLVN